MNFFSAPMPFNNNDIDLIAKINDSHKESKINMLYNCLPINATDWSGFEQFRATDFRINTLEDLIAIVKHAKSLGMDFTYLMNTINTPIPNEFRRREREIKTFLERLLENDIMNLRVSNTMIADYIICNYPEFKVHSSTSQEYYSLKQYTNFFHHFPTIKSVVPSWDVNKNFEFISNFKKKFPDIVMELMVNEGCMGGCPFRRDHHSIEIAKGKEIYKDRFDYFFSIACGTLYHKDKTMNLCLNNIIYPWDIATYNKYGIYNFKLVGRNSPDFLRSSKYIERFNTYLDGIENIESIYDVSLIEFNHYTIFNTQLKDIKVCDIIEYLPKLNYFEKNGKNCANACGVTCNYCYDCAEKIKSEFYRRG